MKRNCVVLGAGRSGTSLVAGSLWASGWNFHSDLLEVSDANPLGFFESKTVNRLNEDLLSQVVKVRPRRIGRLVYRSRLARGQLWLATPPSNRKILEDPRVDREFEAQLPAQPFCVKDPRFSYTLNALQKSLGGALAICCFRHPAVTVASTLREVHNAHYLRSVSLDIDDVYRIWISMYDYVLRHQAGRGDWVFVRYDQMWEPAKVDAISEAVGSSLNLDFRSRDLDRSSPNSDAPVEALEVYSRLCDLAGAEP